MLQSLGAVDYLDFQSNPASAPPGTTKLIYIPVRTGAQLLSSEQIQQLASAKPGSSWYVGGEPNVHSTVDEVVEDFKYYYDEIQSADPTAKISSPSMLNWGFTCLGCGGYASGEVWLNDFFDRYEQLYLTAPPWDFWAIDLYPIDWLNLPNTGFTQETVAKYPGTRPPAEEMIPIEQLIGFRAFIDTKPAFAGDPILITELGIHWGFDGLEFTTDCSTGSPTGNYNLETMIEYFSTIFTWLDANAVSYNVEKWYTFVTYADLESCREDSYGGISLFDSPTDGVSLSDFGQWYKARSAP